MRVQQDLVALGVPLRLSRRLLRVDRSAFLQAVRTTLSAVVSAVLASACSLPEPAWAVVTTIIVMQSSLGTAWRVSRERMIGTAIGAACAAALLGVFRGSVAVFGCGMLLMAGLCALLRQPQSAYRFAGITLAIIALPTYADPPWVVSVHRTIETVIGIVVGMIVMACWRNADADDGARAAAQVGR